MKIGLNYDLKSLFPRIKLLFEEFIQNQIVAFEKELIEIPMTFVPRFAPRYDLNEPIPTRNFGTQVNLTLSKYRTDFLKRDNNIEDFQNYNHQH